MFWPVLNATTVVPWSLAAAWDVGVANSWITWRNASLTSSIGSGAGASRAVTDAGWYPHKFQVGQAGQTVSPQLYVAIGISGAIQHRAGMQTSKTIVAVNKDPEAPMFELADLGVVGDLFTVVPQLLDEISKR
jgi:electron transfer flavoprotein alpha subunit